MAQKLNIKRFHEGQEVTITEMKFIKKEIFEDLTRKSNLGLDIEKFQLDKLYYEVTAIDTDGNEIHWIEFEELPIPYNDNFQEYRKEWYKTFMKARYQVDPEKEPEYGTQAWDFYRENIEVFCIGTRIHKNR